MVNKETEDSDAAGQEEPTDEDVGRIAGEDETEESKVNGEAGENLDGAIARGASGEDGDTETSGVYEFKDNKTTGTVTVVEKWDDQSNNAERPVVDVSLSTAKPSKNPLGYTVTFHADAKKGLTFANGRESNEVVYNKSGQIVSGRYLAVNGVKAVWMADKSKTKLANINEDGSLNIELSEDTDFYAKAVTFEIKGYANSNNGFNQAIPSTATTVVFTDEVRPADATLIDVDADGDGGVVAWTEEDATVMKISTQIAGVKVQAAQNSTSMFYNKSKLQTIDFTNLDTTNVRHMSSMFYGCSRLTSLNLSPLDTSKVMSMESMFSNCSGLTTFITGSNFKFVGTRYTLPGTWQNTTGETFTSGNFPSNVADTYTKVS